MQEVLASAHINAVIKMSAIQEVASSAFIEVSDPRQ